MIELSELALFTNLDHALETRPYQDVRQLVQDAFLIPENDNRFEPDAQRFDIPQKAPC